MIRLIRLSCGALLLAAASLPTWGQTSADSGDFEILGLRLGMSAQEAAQTVQQRLKVPLNDMRMDATPRRYGQKGTFVDVCTISNAQVELVLNFAEVFPGKGAGPEALFFVSYVPKTLFIEDKSDFSERVLAKYGSPTVTVDKLKSDWLPRPYHSSEEAEHAGAAVLELDRSVPRVSLSNPSIRTRMEEAYRETQKVPL